MTESRQRLIAVQILKKKFPGHYEEIMNLMDLKSIIDSDTENIPVYYHRFCRIKGLADISRISSKGDRVNTDSRRLFVAAILYIFSPSTFNGVPLLQSGIYTRVGRVMNISKYAVQLIAEQVVFNHNHLPDFKQDVKFTVFRMTTGWENNSDN